MDDYTHDRGCEDCSVKMRRPLRERVWFWKPELHWFGPKTLLPFGRGGDEWDWHTIVLGWTVTGRMIIATRRCTGTGRCRDDIEELGGLQPDWPANPYPSITDELIAEQGYVRKINGHPVREKKGFCPGCGADEKTWCIGRCKYLDIMDYR